MNLLVLLFLAIGRAAPLPSCASHLQNQNVKTLIELARIAEQRHLVTPEELQVALLSEQPRNPLAFRTLSASDVALSAGFDKALAKYLASPAPESLRSQMATFVNELGISNFERTEAIKSTQPLAAPHLLRPIPLDESFKVHWWHHDSEGRLLFASWSREASAILFFSPYGNGKPTQKIDVPNEGGDFIFSGFSSKSGDFYFAYPSNEFKKPKWWRKQTFPFIIKQLNKSSLLGELKSPPLKFVWHNARGGATHLYAIEQGRIEGFQVNGDTLAKFRVIKFGNGLKPCVVPLTTWDNRTLIFTTNDAGLMQVFEPEVSSSPLQTWTLRATPQQIFPYYDSLRKISIVLAYRKAQEKWTTFGLAVEGQSKPSKLPCGSADMFLHFQGFEWGELANGRKILVGDMGYWNPIQKTIFALEGGLNDGVLKEFRDRSDRKNRDYLVRHTDGRDIFLRADWTPGEDKFVEVFDASNFDLIKRLPVDQGLSCYQPVSLTKGELLVAISDFDGLRVQEALTGLKYFEQKGLVVNDLLPPERSERGEWILPLYDHNHSVVQILALNRN